MEFLINTRLQPGGKTCVRESRFNGLLAGVKPLKRFYHSLRAITGLKPGVNEMASLIGAIQ